MAAPKHEIMHIDVAGDPELVRLAEELHRTGQPRVLRASGRDLAIVLPVGDEAGAESRAKS